MNDLVTTAERLISRAISKFRLIVEVIHAVEWNDRYAASGKGAANRGIDADLAGQYGVYSRPPDGGDAIFLHLGAEGNSSICIGYRHRQYEVVIEKGEVLIRDDQGQLLHLKRDGIYLDGIKVVIGGGGAAAVRVGDPVEFTAAFSQWINTTLLGALAAAGIAVAPFIGPEIGTSSAGSSKVEIG